MKPYFEDLCFAINPQLDITNHKPCEVNFSDVPLNESEQDLNNLLNYVQRHTKHGKHCLRSKGNTKLLCRFRYLMIATMKLLRVIQCLSLVVMMSI